MDFRFKKFTISHRGAAMKVGTDGVLLGAWCAVPEVRALDIGTGTGVIALMLAQRSEAGAVEIDAVEIDPAGAENARLNVAASPWSGRVKVYNARIQDFAAEAVGVAGGTVGSAWAAGDIAAGYAGDTAATDAPAAAGAAGNVMNTAGSAARYDLVVSNPPYFNESLLPPGAARTTARHTRDLSHGDLVRTAARLLLPGGKFAAVLPAVAAEGFVRAAAGAGLRLGRRTDVFSVPGPQPKRVLLEFVAAGGGAAEPVCGTLTIESGGDFTDEYKALTRDFYLKF